MEQVIDIEEENKELVRRYRKLLRHAKPILKDGDTKVIKKAFNTAVEAHKDMRRKSGEPYIYHPIEVAQICVEEIGLGTTSIISALLHDVVEDTDTEIEDIERMFGRKVARIIDGLTKISGVFEYGSSQQAENFRKMVLTLSDDVRVILVKLADRLHNMRTMDSMPRHKQLKISSETIYLYAPLAHRLGLYSIKSELEDLYLKYTDKDTYYEIAWKIRDTKSARNTFIREFIKPIQEKLRENYFEFKIKGRPKSIYSIWNKMKKQNIPFEEVYDLFAIRIIINCAKEDEKNYCWQVYSIVTDNYKPSPDRLRDWISTPKANGYESLHTTVMSSAGRWVECQIRTERMDDVAEKGYAAHWKYKDDGTVQPKSGLDMWISKVRDLLEQSDSNAIEFVDDFRHNLFNEEIFVFTPKGDLKVLPTGATALDFAFEIHSQVGLHCLGAKINHKLVPLSQELKNGDQVEVLTSNKQHPSDDWLRYVVTSKARKRIKDFLNDGKRLIENRGKELLNKRIKQFKSKTPGDYLKKMTAHFKLNNAAELYYQIGKGIIDLKELSDFNDLNPHPTKAAAKPISKKGEEFKKIKEINKGTLVIGDGIDDIDYRLAKCCNPIPGDDIFGFVTINEGIKIHRTKCNNATELMSNYGYRIIKAQWHGMHETQFIVGLRITGTDRLGLIHDITNVVSKNNEVNIQAMNAETMDGIIHDVLMLEVSGTEHLDGLIDRLKKINGILTVERFEPE